VSAAWFTNVWYLSRADFGLFYRRTYAGDYAKSIEGNQAGAELALQSVVNHFRASVAAERNLGNGEWLVSAQIGLADFNGLTYWLLRTAFAH
jgi:hypothetical protein